MKDTDEELISHCCWCFCLGDVTSVLYNRRDWMLLFTVPKSWKIDLDPKKRVALSGVIFALCFKNDVLHANYSHGGGGHIGCAKAFSAPKQSSSDFKFKWVILHTSRATSCPDDLINSLIFHHGDLFVWSSCELKSTQCLRPLTVPIDWLHAFFPPSYITKGFLP